jgi:hypothetical protein
VRHGIGLFAAAVAALACGRGQAPAPPPALTTVAAPAPSPVAAENALTGGDGWQLHHRAPPGVLEGYAGATSVQHGEALDVHVRADGDHHLRWEVWRMGWYGGAQGRLLARGGPVAVGRQPTPAPTSTGLVECRWPVTFTIPTDVAWTSGVHVVKLVRDDGFDAHVPFVVRADERKGAAVFQASFTTYQAYNAWGGFSLYDGSPPAVEVSFDRPFLEGNGAGHYFRYEHFFVTWAESRGYDLTYVTDVDVWRRRSRRGRASPSSRGTRRTGRSGSSPRAPTADRAARRCAGRSAPTPKTRCAARRSRRRAGAIRRSANRRARSSA